MKRTLIFLALAVLVMATAFPAGAATVLKIATVAPDGSTWMQEMRKAAGEIEARTEERVRLKFFGGGVMGTEKSVLRKIRVGQLHGGAFVSGGLSDLYPDLRLYSLPLVFRSEEEIAYVRQRLDPILAEGLAERGFVTFGFAGGGFAMLMAETPLRTLEDLKGRKIWVPQGDVVNQEVMLALGLSPVSLPLTDVLTGLQTGLLDIVGTSPIGAIAFQWHTQVKYITDTPLAYIFGFLAVDRRTFERLAPPDRQVVREVMERTYDHFEKLNRRDNREALQALRQQGLTVITPDPQELVPIRENSRAALTELAADKIFSPDLYRQMLEYLEEYRRAQKPATRP